MIYEEVIEKLAKMVQNTDDGYDINDAEVREFIEQYPEYCNIISNNKEIDLDWIIKEIKGEN